MKQTLESARSTIARVLGVCSTDARVAEVINESVMRLLPQGRWVGTTAHFDICVNGDSCLTFPRQVEAIDAFAICTCPGVIRNEWFEFLGHGPGILDADSCNGNTLVPRGDGYVVHTDISGVDKKVRVIADVGESASARILLKGYDYLNNWVRTQDPAGSGTWIDGEYVTISTTATDSVNKFSVLTGVDKPTTNGKVRLYSYSTTDASLVALAEYEPDEKLPSYRRYLVPGLADRDGCDDCTDCAKTTLHVVAKLRFVPVVNAKDEIMIGNLSALKLMAQAIRKEEADLWDEARKYEAAALKCLEDELDAWQGAGTVHGIRVTDRDTWGVSVLQNAL